MQLAVQTFTVRHDAIKDLPATLVRLKGLGITGLELARIRFSDADAEAIVSSGMRVFSIQVTYSKLKSRYDDMVRFCQKTGCGIVVISVLPKAAIIGLPGALKRFARAASSLAGRYSAHGIKLAFHHHNFEFRRINGRTKLEWLLQLCPPEVHFVSDTYWAARSGHDPLTVVDLLGGRLLGLHLRDLAKQDSPERGRDCEVGSGCIDFERIVSRLPPAVVYGAIEQDSSRPWESLKQSIAYCRSRHIGTDQTKEI